MTTKAWTTAYDVVLICGEIKNAWEKGSSSSWFSGRLKDLEDAARAAIDNDDNFEPDDRHGEEAERCRERLRAAGAATGLAGAQS